MIGALATTLCFALTPVFANQAAHRLGSSAANFWRLFVALLALGLWAHGWGAGFGGAAKGWFFLGGLAGFGLGGLAMFQSLPRLGSSLSTLIVQCGSAVTAALLEWTWLGTGLTPVQTAGIAITLSGVTLGLMPRSLPRVSPAEWPAGLAWALFSALGQGTGAVLSRKAFAVAHQLNAPIDAGTAAYLRVIAGLLVAALAWGFVCWRRIDQPRRPGRAWAWVLANAFTGPILGVVFFQWALRTTPAGIVQAIVATSPLLIIPFSVRMEGNRPRVSYFFGAGLAVVGVAALFLFR